ncbi:MAG: OmpA family protein [Alistipes sp.]|nr:OmpA family protein [Alistipes sp.]
MKKLFSILLLLALAPTVMAQGDAQKPSCRGFVSNGFWDNWEISGNLGAATALSDGKNLGDFGSRIGLEGNIAATKWIHPVFGLRLQLQGGRFINFDPDWGEMKYPYLFTHVDMMLNFSNWVGGYRDNRAYYAMPFAGFGYMATNFTDQGHLDNRTGTLHDYAFTMGWLNRFRLSPSVDFNIELKGLLVPSRLSPAQMDGHYLFGFSTTVGFTYRFHKRGWQRCNATAYSADDIRAFQDAVAAGKAELDRAKAENERLNRELAAAKAAPAPAPAPAEVIEALDGEIILFDYGMSTLSDQEKTRLQIIAEQIKNGPKERVYTLKGYADQQTGTAASNRRVAANRAKRVYDYLVSLGVDADRLTYEGKGNVPNIYKNIQKANRAVVIE